MQPFSIWHHLAIIVGIISLIIVTYTTILLNTFRTPETTADFLSKSNTFYYIAEIIKADIRTRYPPQLKTNPIKITIADTLLTDIVTPNLIERFAMPVLQAQRKLAQLPTSFAGNNLVLNTKQYTDQLSTTISSFQLPSVLQDAANELIAAIPLQITLVNTQQNPNSILAAITQTRIIFENIQTIQRIFGILLILSVLTLIICNLKLLKRLTSGLIWFFGTGGLILLILSLISPAVADSLSNNPDPVAGVLKDQMVNGLVSYYFSLTRNISFIYILIAIGLFLVYRYVPFDEVSQWLYMHTTSQPVPARTTGKQRKKTR